MVSRRAFIYVESIFFAGIRPNLLVFLFIYFTLFLILLCQKLKMGQFNVLY